MQKPQQKPNLASSPYDASAAISRCNAKDQALRCQRGKPAQKNQRCQIGHFYDVKKVRNSYLKNRLERLPTMTNQGKLDQLTPLSWKHAREKSLQKAARIQSVDTRQASSAPSIEGR